jgi:hypothetical protein
LLRERLHAEGDLKQKDGDAFDEDVEQAVRRFQWPRPHQVHVPESV